MSIDKGLLLLLLISLTTTSVYVQCSILSDCSEDPTGSLISATVKGCDLENDEFCKLISGQDASIQINFRAEEQLTHVKVRVAGVFGVVSIPFPIIPDDACNNYNLTCPIQPGNEQTFSISLPVKNSYPKVALDIQMKLINQDVKQVVCVLFPAKIVES